MDTIYALSTAQGKAGVAIVRISGPQAWETISRVTGVGLPSPRVASVRRIVSVDGSTLDQALVLLFEEGRSFTGEESAEVHLHGSIAVCDAVLKRIGDDASLRLAEPGEFTKRALLNDRLDLTEVAGLSDLLEAETEAQRREAMRAFEGGFRIAIEGWRRNLVRALALLEVTIDFADEEVPTDVMPEVTELLAGVLGSLKNELGGFQAAQELRRGFEVAIVGPPNIGKSTLLNALAGREAALTSDIAGTTRDIIEVRMDLHGLPVVFLDTAGIRETVDEIEAQGVDRAKSRAEDAALRLFLVETGCDPALSAQAGDLIYETKADLTGHGISAMTGSGIDELIKDVTRVLRERSNEAGLVSQERQRRAVSEAADRLQKALDQLHALPTELVAAEIYGAVSHLESLIGRVGVEDILDDVFSNFCLGK